MEAHEAFEPSGDLDRNTRIAFPIVTYQYYDYKTEFVSITVGGCQTINM
jgi:hypothetical protein